ncbi:L,D-transpeptidase [Octadecabacter sp. CECT 8868]|uniref:L,D-transpeptidase n=1 Tax=Octadecabacter algicola TaxID=2909342 RepID=UPI001F276917|nr:L,D-transpeptidase [Octadecabacter algicola]MCF2904907.1 L,D-transpeptidase [Octadecabacter algicola]
MQFSTVPTVRFALMGLAIGVLSACAERVEMIGGIPADQIVEGYGFLEDNGYNLPPIPAEYLSELNRRTVVEYNGPEAAGTIVVDPHAKLLYFVGDDGTARRYPIAVGRQGMSMSRPSTVQLKREWPGWTPTQNMLRTQPEVYGPFARGVEGGLASPLGARALYLFQNGRDTHFRIHGTNDLPSIGNSGSAGCIRMFNHDIIDLFDDVPNGTRVVVRTYAASVELEGEAVANRGVILEPNIVDPDLIYGTGEDDAVELDEIAEDVAVDPLSASTISGG